MPLSSRLILLAMYCERRLKSSKDCQNGFDSRIQTENLVKDKPVYKPQEGGSSQPAENPAQDSDASGQSDVAAGENKEADVAAGENEETGVAADENEETGVTADENEETGVEADAWSGLAEVFSGPRSSLQFTESVDDITLVTASKDYIGAIEAAAWSKRAWGLQECNLKATEELFERAQRQRLLWTCYFYY